MLTDTSRAVQFKVSGADDVAIRLARLLTSPALARAAEGGIDPLPRDAEASALRTLAAVATARDAALGRAEAEGLVVVEGEGEYPNALLATFVSEKRTLLQASAAALEAQARAL